MAKIEFPELPTKAALAGMKAEEVANVAASLTGFMDGAQKEYKEKMASLHAEISKKIVAEKAGRDRDPTYKALEQGVGR